MQIGQIIRKYRKSKNMTQEEMAERLGVTAPAVNKWESGYCSICFFAHAKASSNPSVFSFPFRTAITMSNTQFF